MYNETEKVSPNVVSTNKVGGAKKGKENPGSAPPQQPGVMMWNAGIIYFAEQFTAETTKPVINTIIEKKVSIGNNCLIGAKALITENKEIPDNSLVIGSPGKVVREVTEEEKKAVWENTKHYQDNWKKYSKSIF